MTHAYPGAARLLRPTLFACCLGLLSGFAARAQTLSGTYYVGTSPSPDPSHTYASLPVAMAAVATSGIAAGDAATFTLLDATYALGSTTLTVPAPAGAMLIKPNTGVSPVITSSATGGAIVLDGTDYLTITGNDGSSANPPTTTITIRNTAAGAAVALQNDATHNTLNYLALESGSTSASGTVFFGASATSGTGNDFNTVVNSTVRDLSVAPNTVPAYAIYSLGTGAATSGVPATTSNSDNTVQGCTIYNFTAGGVYLNDTGSGSNWTVSGNSIYQTATRGANIRGIRVTYGSGHMVSNNSIYQTAGTTASPFYGIAVANGANGVTVMGNTIGGAAADATGSAMSLTGTAAVYGIFLSVGTTTPCSIQGNSIRNISSASTGTLYSIDLQNGAANIGTAVANTVGGTGAGQGLSNAGPAYGLLVENAATSTVQNNTFAGISSSGGLVAGVYLSGTGISTVASNTISTLSSAVATGTVSGVYNTSSGASPVNTNQIANLSATGGASVVGVNLTGSAATTISGNTISNLSSNATTASLLAGINIGTGAVVISTNTISNLTQAGLSTNLYGIQSNFVTGSNVTGNTLSNITYSGTSTGQTIYGIYAGGSNTVSGNSVTNTSITVGGTNNLRGIYLGGAAGATPTVVGNTVSGVTSAATGAANIAGIYVGSTTTGAVLGAAIINTNSISNVGSTSTAANTAALTIAGLQLGAGGTTNSGAAATSVAERNRIWNVYGSTASTGTNVDQVRGLLVQGVYAGTFSNNEVGMAAGAASQLTYGMVDATTGNSNNYYYNTVYVAPVTGGGASSYGFFRSNASTPSTVSLLNNLLYNGRTAASGSNAFALGTASTNGFTVASSNYNLFIVPSAAVVGNLGGTAYSFASWKTQTGDDASSLSETSANVPAANLFANTATGNLDLNPANPEAWYVNGNGVQLTGQAADYGSATAARSTTVAGGSTDIGADELTPTSPPPALGASAAPSLGGTQTFTLGGRPLASLAYGSAGTVPTSVVARYYSGTNPPAPLAAGARYANVYFTFTDANGDGNGYTYQPTLYYDPALLGTITSETAQQIAPRRADNTGYTVASTTVTTTARTLTGLAGFARLGVLAIADMAAPLPVTLAAFTAFRVGDNVQLSWNSASEQNSRGYEVQVSADGVGYRALGFVNSQFANSQTAQYYTFTDHEAGKQGVRYYRLRQVDLDGREQYSPVAAVAFEGVAHQAVLTAVPNPFGDKLTLTLTTAAPATARLMVTDALGRVVLARALSVPAGASQHELAELAGLPAGLYLVQVATPGGSPLRLKLVKE